MLSAALALAMAHMLRLTAGSIELDILVPLSLLQLLLP